MSEAQQEFEKESRDPMIRKLSSLLVNELRQMPNGFCIQNEALQADEVAAHNGLLSLFCYKAAELCSEVMKKNLPLIYEHDTSALINVVPMTNGGDSNLFTLWSHFLHYSVEEEIRKYKKNKKLVNGMVPLDNLYQEWHQAVQGGRYIIRPSTKPGAESKNV